MFSILTGVSTKAGGKSVNNIKVIGQNGETLKVTTNTVFTVLDVNSNITSPLGYDEFTRVLDFGNLLYMTRHKGYCTVYLCSPAEHMLISNANFIGCSQHSGAWKYVDSKKWGISDWEETINFQPVILMRQLLKNPHANGVYFVDNINGYKSVLRVFSKHVIYDFEITDVFKNIIARSNL